MRTSHAFAVQADWRQSRVGSRPKGSAIRATVQAEAILTRVIRVALRAPFGWIALLLRLVVVARGWVAVTARPDTPLLAGGGVACMAGFVFRRGCGLRRNKQNRDSGGG